MSHGMGYVESKKDLRDYKLNKKVCTGISLPDEFQVQHSFIKNQGSVGSCVAHSVAEVLEILEDNNLKYSTAWIYGYRPVGYYQGMGMMTSEALKTVRNVGSLQYANLPGNIEVPQAKELVDEHLSEYKEKAKDDKIASYARLKSVQEIKEAIFTTGKPVVVCIKCDSLKLDENYVAKIPSKFTGGHATVCYGWNEKGLLIQNSWGSKWGDHGCFILPYNYPIKESWVITKDKNITVKPSAFELREFLVNIGRIVVKIIKGLFNRKQ